MTARVYVNLLEGIRLSAIHILVYDKKENWDDIFI